MVADHYISFSPPVTSSTSSAGPARKGLKTYQWAGLEQLEVMIIVITWGENNRFFLNEFSDNGKLIMYVVMTMGMLEDNNLKS